MYVVVIILTTICGVGSIMAIWHVLAFYNEHMKGKAGKLANFILQLFILIKQLNEFSA